MQKRFTKFDMGKSSIPAPKYVPDHTDTETSARRDLYAKLLANDNQKRKIVIPIKPTKFALVPFVAAILILMMLLQSASYLSSARNAQGEILGAATSAYSDLSSAGQ